MKKIFFILVLFSSTLTNAQQKKIDFGINLSGYERFWENKKRDYKDIITDIDDLYNQGITDIRLPVSFESQFELQSKKRFLRELVKIIKHVKKKNMTLIICYFDYKMDKNTNFTNIDTLKENWKYIANKLKKYSNYIAYEIVNEPNLYPLQWDFVVHEIINEIRKKDSKTKILIGATNYNSIYELSRTIPYPYNNIVYIFHFYEPFIFTHQGANWVGDQVQTTNIPYPYDSINMPNINLKTIGTPGEINYKDYKHMANKTALSHKINIVVAWAKQHNVQLWCTEFGTIGSIPVNDRCNYFKDVISIFKEHNIKCYLWEYKGNFGIHNNNALLNCF
ncbi:glycoside hydrolase family 5 protein [Wenyingzhuangia sp. IMCC45467]